MADDSSDNYMDLTEETQTTKSNCTISKNSIIQVILFSCVHVGTL